MADPDLHFLNNNNIVNNNNDRLLSFNLGHNASLPFPHGSHVAFPQPNNGSILSQVSKGLSYNSAGGGNCINGDFQNFGRGTTGAFLGFQPASLFSNPAMQFLPQFTTASGNFTFTVPTRSSLSGSMTTNIQPGYVHTSRATPHTFAPGVGSPWQHSIPVRIPWLETSAPMTITANGVSTFRAPATSQTHKDALSNPKPSCSQIPRRPKRHASDMHPLSPTRKVHLTEEKIAQHMEELRISGLPSSQTSNSEHFTDNAARWQNFKKLEDGIELSDDEDLPDIVKHEQNVRQPKLCILEDLKVQDTRPVIPQHLIEEMVKPPMEIILWKPPGDIIKEAVSSCLSHRDVDDVGNVSQDKREDQPDLIKNISCSAIPEDTMDEDMADFDMQL